MSASRIAPGGFFTDADFDFEARIALGAAATGIGDVGLVLAILDQVTDGDRQSWFDAWSGMAKTLAGYRRVGAVPDRDRVLGRTRALGIRRGPREAHREADYGWASLTTSEVRIAALVRDGLTNREIGTRLFVSPRTVQTRVSHILQKTGLRSRVEIARAAGLRSAKRRMSERSPARSVLTMKPLPLILAFLPLIAFSLLSRLLPRRLGGGHRRAGPLPVAAAVIDRSTTSHFPQLVLGTLVPIAIIIYMLKFSQSYPDRGTHHESDAASRA